MRVLRLSQPEQTSSRREPAKRMPACEGIETRSIFLAPEHESAAKRMPACEGIETCLAEIPRILISAAKRMPACEGIETCRGCCRRQGR